MSSNATTATCDGGALAPLFDGAGPLVPADAPALAPAEVAQHGAATALVLVLWVIFEGAARARARARADAAAAVVACLLGVAAAALLTWRTFDLLACDGRGVEAWRWVALVGGAGAQLLVGVALPPACARAGVLLALLAAAGAAALEWLLRGGAPGVLAPAPAAGAGHPSPSQPLLALQHVWCLQAVALLGAPRARAARPRARRARASAGAARPTTGAPRASAAARSPSSTPSRTAAAGARTSSAATPATRTAAAAAGGGRAGGASERSAAAAARRRPYQKEAERRSERGARAPRTMSSPGRPFSVYDAMSHLYDLGAANAPDDAAWRRARALLACRFASTAEEFVVDEDHIAWRALQRVRVRRWGEAVLFEALHRRKGVARRGVVLRDGDRVLWGTARRRAPARPRAPPPHSSGSTEKLHARSSGRSTV